MTQMRLRKLKITDRRRVIRKREPASGSNIRLRLTPSGLGRIVCSSKEFEKRRCGAIPLQNDRFLVTGGAGFIGSELVRQLAARGARVRVVDNLVNGRRENL